MVAVTDYMRAVPDQMSRFVERRFVSLGTDGFGRSDTREALRSYFEVDAPHVVLAVLAALAEEGEGKPDEVAEAISRYGLETERPTPGRSELRSGPRRRRLAIRNAAPANTTRMPDCARRKTEAHPGRPV